MKLLWFILITIIAGLLLGPVIQNIPGTLVLIYDQTSIQMRAWQALVMWFGLTLVLVLCYHLLLQFIGSASRLRLWSGNRRWLKARQKTIRGMIALAEGQWLKAEQLLVAGAANTDTALINYLAAAQAAQAQKQLGRRDEYLRRAHMAEPDAEIAVGLTQAQLQLSQGQLEEALASLTHLRQLAPKHAHVAWLVAKLYERLEEWQPLTELLPLLKKSDLLAETDYASLERRAWTGRLQQVAKDQGLEALQDVWSQLSKALRNDPVITHQFIQQLLVCGGAVEAEKLLLTGMRKQHNEDFLRLYGLLETNHTTSQLAEVEKLAKAFQQSATWYITAGRLALRDQILGKAKAYIEQAIALQPSTEAHLLMAQTADLLADAPLAAAHYKQAALTHQ